MENKSPVLKKKKKYHFKIPLVKDLPVPYFKTKFLGMKFRILTRKQCCKNMKAFQWFTPGK